MTTTEIIKDLCEKYGISVRKLESDLGLSNGSIKKDANMRGDRLLAIAKYFNVSMEYLMGSESLVWNPKSQEMFKPNDEERYYLNDDTEDIAQFLFENPEYKVLFDASRKLKKEDISKALKAVGIFIDEE